jgi:ubiquinone/menaquinone biosynthesis C-methylase UbiE
MNAKTHYGYPISSIFFQVCGMILLSLLAILTIVLGIFYVTLLIIVLALLFWYFVIHQFKERFSQLRTTILVQMIDYARLNGHENILDLGTGAGYLAIGFSKAIQSGQVVGVDKYDQGTSVLGNNFFEELRINFFKNKLNQAKRNASIEKQMESILLVKSDLKKHFPFTTQSFDLILSSQFLYCIPRKKLDRVLWEIDRVLRPKGKLVFFESEKFLNWNISKVQAFFEALQYETRIYPLKKMSNKCILIAEKSNE